MATICCCSHGVYELLKFFSKACVVYLRKLYMVHIISYLHCNTFNLVKFVCQLSKVLCILRIAFFNESLSLQYCVNCTRCYSKNIVVYSTIISDYRSDQSQVPSNCIVCLFEVRDLDVGINILL